MEEKLLRESNPNPMSNRDTSQPAQPISSALVKLPILDIYVSKMLNLAVEANSPGSADASNCNFF